MSKKDNILCFLFVFIAVNGIKFIYWLIVGFILSALGISRIGPEFVYNLIFVIPAIVSMYACITIAEKMEAYKALKVFCIISLCLNVLFIIVNILDGNNSFNNLIWILFFCVNCIVQCNKEMRLQEARKKYDEEYAD